MAGTRSLELMCFPPVESASVCCTLSFSPMRTSDHASGVLSAVRYAGGVRGPRETTHQSAGLTMASPRGCDGHARTVQRGTHWPRRQYGYPRGAWMSPESPSGQYRMKRADMPAVQRAYRIVDKFLVFNKL